jgi:hypothetical protein
VVEQHALVSAFDHPYLDIKMAWAVKVVVRGGVSRRY